MKRTGAYFVIIALLAGTLFAPTMISESLLYPFITGKNLLFRSLVILGAVVFAYIVYTKKTFVLVKTPIHIAFLSFVGVLLLADLLGVNPLRSLFSNFERMEGWFTHLLLFVFFFIITQTITTLQAWRTVVQVSLVANIYVMLFALGQYLGMINIFQSVDRIDGTLGNATYLAGYAMMYVFLLSWLAYTARETSARWLYGVLGLVNIFIIFVSLTRGGVVALVAGTTIAALLLIAFEKKYIRLKHFALAALGIIILTTSLIVLNKNSDFVKTTPVLNRIASVSNIESLDSRLEIWSISYEGLKERPILGWGQDNFLYVFSKHFTPTMAEREPWFDRSHNVFFDWLIAAGILGLIVYLALFIIPVYVMWISKKTKNNFSVIEKSLWTGFLSGYFIFNIFVFDNIVTYIIFVFVLGYITWKAFVSQDAKEVKINQSWTTIIATAIVLLAIVAFIYLVFKPITSAKTLIQALQYSQIAIEAPNDETAREWSRQNIGTGYTKNELSALAREKFTRATKHELGRVEAREQLAQRLVTIVRSQGLSEEEKKEWAVFTFSEIEDELKRDQNNPRTYQIAGLLFLQFGKTDEAIQLLDRAQELSPNKQLIMFDRALAYQVAGDYEKTLAISKQAYDLNPSFLAAKAKYILALYRVGRDVEAVRVEQEFLQEAREREYDLVVSKAYESQVKMAKVEYRGKEAGAAYKRGDMGAYAKYYAEIKALDPDSALRLTEWVKALK